MANTTTSSLLAENPEQAEEKREADEAFQRAGEEADFGARAESLKISLGGIGQRSPEEASIVSGDVAQAEAQDPENEYPDDDLLAAFNTIGSDPGTPENENPSPEIGGKGEVIEAPSEEIEGEDTQASEDPASPLLERLVTDGVISSEIQQQLQEKLAAGMEFSQVIESSDIEANAKQMIQDRWEDMNNPETAKENQKTFEADFGSIFPDVKDETGAFKDTRMEEVFTMVGSAYLVGASHNPLEQKASLDMAFKTAGNKAIKGKQFERSISFQENMKVLQDVDANPNERMETLTSVLKLVDTDQGKKGLKTKENRETGDETSENTQLTDMIEEADVGAEFDTALIAFQSAQTSGDTQNIEAAQEKVTQIIEQAAELTGTPLGNMVSTALEMGEVDAGQETSPKTA